MKVLYFRCKTVLYFLSSVLYEVNFPEIRTYIMHNCSQKHSTCPSLCRYSFKASAFTLPVPAICIDLTRALFLHIIAHQKTQNAAVLALICHAWKAHAS